MAEAQIIDGRPFADAVTRRVGEAVARLTAEHGLQPGLAVILVGDDPASQIYVRSKGEQSRAVGMASTTHRLSAATPQAELIALVGRLNADPAVHGILIQLPLPKTIDTGAVLAALDPEKDVDGLTEVSAGRLASGRPALIPCTPLGCMILLQGTLGDLTGLNAVVIGRSVLVAAIGRPRFVRGDWIKPGAAVIDVGVNRVPFRDPVKAAQGKTKVVGDVDFAQARKIAGWITPVPGGVGLMTVACLLQNTLTAAARLHGLNLPWEMRT